MTYDTSSDARPSGGDRRQASAPPAPLHTGQRAGACPAGGARPTGAPAGAPQRQQLLLLLATPDDVDGPHARRAWRSR